MLSRHAPSQSAFGLGELRACRKDPHPVIVTIRDTSNYIRVLLYSYHTTITGGVHLSYARYIGNYGSLDVGEVHSFENVARTLMLRIDQLCASNVGSRMPEHWQYSHDLIVILI